LLRRLEERHARVERRVARQVTGVVVLDLVVVPDRHDRMRRAEGPQVAVGVVERVLGAVLGEGLHLPVAVRARGVAPDRLVVEVALVDVVAEAHRQVEVRLLRQRGMGGVVARLVVLAGEEADAHRLARVRRPAGPEPPDRPVGVPRREPVPVGLGGQQAGRDALVDGEPGRGAGQDVLAVDDAAKAGVGGHFELELRVGADPLHPRPQGDGVRPRLARRHALREGDVARGRLRPRRAAQEERSAGPGGGGDEAAAGHGGHGGEMPGPRRSPVIPL
jgi:hypothetical protein